MLIRAKFPPGRRLRAVDMTTAHIPQRLASHLGVINGFFRFVPYEHGTVLVRIGSEKPSIDDKITAYMAPVGLLPSEVEYLMALHQWCREHKVDIVTFDSAGDLVPGFPVYDW